MSPLQGRGEWCGCQTGASPRPVICVHLRGRWVVPLPHNRYAFDYHRQCIHSASCLSAHCTARMPCLHLFANLFPPTIGRHGIPAVPTATSCGLTINDGNGSFRPYTGLSLYMRTVHAVIAMLLRRHGGVIAGGGRRKAAVSEGLETEGTHAAAIQPPPPPAAIYVNFFRT